MIVVLKNLKVAMKDSKIKSLPLPWRTAYKNMGLNCSKAGLD